MKKIALIFSLVVVVLLSSCVPDKPISQQALLKKDTATIGSYLRHENIVSVNPQPGVWYVIDSLAAGILPVLSDSIKISYTAKSIPSLSIVDQAAPFNALLSSANAGFQISLPNFPAYSKGRLFLASGLAFGASPHGNIPPNSNLQYEIKLIEVIKGKSTHLATDVAAIDAYLNVKTFADSLKARKDSVYRDISGLRYTIDTLGASSIKPLITSTIKVTYSGKILKRDSLFVNTTETFLLKDQKISALKIILPKITKGSYVTMYVPSGYGYGSAASKKVPANSNLVYRIKLNEVY